MTSQAQKVTQLCLQHYPNIQAIYLFGSWETEYETPSSDIDIALLLPIPQTKSLSNLYHTDLHRILEHTWQRDVDLIHLRQVSTVLQKEVIQADRRIYCADTYAADEFEMLVMSYYQKLNDERADILHDFYNSKRAG
ncbi:MAG: nucleotidyltransferase domain-containing protein [Mariprofundaceae bacterium]|nr:nucleotidyltransferase domain-containing protein [Mariprofundaceae bacterium]